MSLEFQVGDKVRLNEAGKEYVKNECSNMIPRLVNGLDTVGIIETVGLHIQVKFPFYEGKLYDGHVLLNEDELEAVNTSEPVEEIKDTETIGKFEKKGQELGALVDSKQKAYGNAVDQTYEVLKVFLEPYRFHDGYKIPEELLPHLLLQTRIIDKQCRIFSNPKADLMGESPYKDISGYSLLGSELQENSKEVE